jgi:nicotinic acid mononucleotide adenylyltransferase
MIVGADQLARFHRWKNYREIMDIVKIIAFNRSQNNFKPPKGMNISWIADFKIDISSTKIRNKIATGNLPVEDLTSEILDYIQANKLYESKS